MKKCTNLFFLTDKLYEMSWRAKVLFSWLSASYSLRKTQLILNMSNCSTYKAQMPNSPPQCSTHNCQWRGRPLEKLTICIKIGTIPSACLELHILEHNLVNRICEKLLNGRASGLQDLSQQCGHPSLHSLVPICESHCTAHRSSLRTLG